MKDNDIWKPVKGYEGIYEVNKNSTVRSIDHLVVCKNRGRRIQKGRVLKTRISLKGYVQVSLSKNTVRFNTGVHRVAAIAFIPNPKNLPQVNHIDGNKQNNRIENLEWCTNSYNQNHAVKNKLINPNYGEKHHQAKLQNFEVQIARNLHYSGATNIKLAKYYNISATAMSKILRKITYTNI